MFLKNKRYFYIALSAVILLLVFGIVANLFAYLADLKDESAKLSSDLRNTNAALSQAFDILVASEERLALLEMESLNLASAQSRIQAESDARIAALSQALSNTQSGLDLSAVIKAWRPYIAQISCTIDTPRAIAETSGSALLSRTSKYPYAHLITNKHVLMYDGYSAESCKVNFPDFGNITITAAAISYPSKNDIGIVDISGKNDVIDLRGQNAAGRKICSAVSVGEKVVILGYPNIGSKSDITATEGIISGFDGDYYITSAKIEQGNSGGAAVLIRGAETCYLGIPTFVNVGKIEALARILSAKVLQ